MGITHYVAGLRVGMPRALRQWTFFACGRVEGKCVGHSVIRLVCDHAQKNHSKKHVAHFHRSVMISYEIQEQCGALLRVDSDQSAATIH